MRKLWYSLAIVSGLLMPAARLLALNTNAVQLTASDGVIGRQFGFSVAVNDNTIAVGAPPEELGGVSAGAAYVFVRDGAAWKT